MTTARDNLPEAEQPAPAVGSRLDRHVRPLSPKARKLAQELDAMGHRSVRVWCGLTSNHQTVQALQCTDAQSTQKRGRHERNDMGTAQESMKLQQALTSYVYRNFDVTGAVVQFPPVEQPNDWRVHWPSEGECHPQRKEVDAAIYAFVAGWSARRGGQGDGYVALCE